MDLREKLQTVLRLLNLHGYELAKELRITPEWLSKIMRGHVKAPNPDIGLRLDEFLRRRGIDPSSIEEGSIKPEDVLQVEEVKLPPEYAARRRYVETRALRAVLQQEWEEALAATGGKVERLGWLLEQVRTHLRPPPHWAEADAPKPERAEIKSEVAALITEARANKGRRHSA